MKKFLAVLFWLFSLIIAIIYTYENPEKFDVIITNPPFGGQEESVIAKSLPEGFHTSDTALAFLLYIMESLEKNGRCGIILPNGPLFAGGIAAKIKERLLDEFNLHTIIRMPETVFEPYTTIATNILFFDKTKPTKEIWYYQMKVSERLRGVTRAKNPKYTKTTPIAYEDFAPSNSGFSNKCVRKTAKADLPEPYGPISDQERGLSSASKASIMRSKVWIDRDVGM